MKRRRVSIEPMAPGTTTFTLIDPADEGRIYVGVDVVFRGRLRWWVRLWRWLTRRRPTVCTVTKIDRRRGVVTVSAARLK